MRRLVLRHDPAVLQIAQQIGLLAAIHGAEGLRTPRHFFIEAPECLAGVAAILAHRSGRPAGRAVAMPAIDKPALPGRIDRLQFHGPVLRPRGGQTVLADLAKVEGEKAELLRRAVEMAARRFGKHAQGHIRMLPPLLQALLGPALGRFILAHGHQPRHAVDRAASPVRLLRVFPERPLPADGERRQGPLRIPGGEVPRKRRGCRVAHGHDRRRCQFGIARFFGQRVHHRLELFARLAVETEVHVPGRRNPDFRQAALGQGRAKLGVLQDRLFLHVVLGRDHGAHVPAIGRNPEKRAGKFLRFLRNRRADRDRPLPDGRRARPADEAQPEDRQSDSAPLRGETTIRNDLRDFKHLVLLTAKAATQPFDLLEFRL